MKRSATRKRSALRMVELDPVKLGPTIAEAFPIGEEQMPSRVLAWIDQSGRPRRLRADYDNGWRVQLRISVDGWITSSSASIRMVAKTRGKA